MLWLLLQLGLTMAAGGTPHVPELVWPGIAVTDTNDDGTTFQRPPLGYWVQRATVDSSGAQGPWIVLNPDAPVIGFMEDDGTLDMCSYRDESYQQGFNYLYAVSAVDGGGESGLSGFAAPGEVPINPNSPLNVKATVN